MKNFIKLLNRNAPLGAAKEGAPISRVLDDRQLLAVLAKDHYFRMLSDDEAEAVSIIDNRKVGESPNNDILVTCDHATNDLKGFKPEPYEDALIRSNDGFDPGAADLTNYISESTACMGVMTNFSRLLIDPGVPICNEKLVRVVYDSDPTKLVSFNSQEYELELRLSSFYSKYHKILTESMWFL